MPRRSRSRSRSPRRDRGGRDRSRERDGRRDRVDKERGSRREDRPRERGGERFSRRSRSRSPADKNFRTAPGSSGSAKPVQEETKKFTAEDFAGKSEEEIEMMKLMGFGGFDTSKGKKVDGNDVGAVHVKLKRVYRQYMNRRGGFNRPLDAVI